MPSPLMTLTTRAPQLEAVLHRPQAATRRGRRVAPLLEQHQAGFERARNAGLDADALQLRPGRALAIGDEVADVGCRRVGEHAQQLLWRVLGEDVDVAGVALAHQIVELAQRTAAAVRVDVLA